MKAKFKNLSQAVFIPLLSTLFFIMACIGLFNWNQDAHAASFLKPTRCAEGLNEFPIGFNPPLTQPAVPPLVITKQNNNLTLVVHGWNGSSEGDLKTIADGSRRNGFDTLSYSWDPLSTSRYVGSPPYPGQARRVGECLGYDIVNKGYTYVHLVGHSLGSAAIHQASITIKNLAPSTTVILTGLDSYIGFASVDFGKEANYADHYFSSGGITDMPNNSLTERQFPSACNVDVTGLQYDGSFTGDGHGWPNQFYVKTIQNPTQLNFKALGFANHREYTNTTPTFGSKCTKNQVIALDPCLVNCFPNTASCTQPTVSTPTNGINLSSGSTITFSWTTTCPTSSYEIKNTTGSSSSGTTSAKSVSKSLTAGSWTFRVQGKDSTGKATPWTPTVNFTVGSTSGGSGGGGTGCTTPIITNPTSGKNYAAGGPVALSWSTGCPASYFEITGGPYTSPQTSGWIGATSYTYASGLWTGNYNIRVQGKTSTGALTSWSASVPFTVGGGSGTVTPPPPTCSGNAVVTDTANKCAGLSNANCFSLASLGLGGLKSVAPNSGWSVVVSSRTDCSDEIGRYQQGANVDAGVSSGAKAVRAEAVLPTDCPTLPSTGGIKAYRDRSFVESGGCRILTLTNGGIPSFPAVGYPSGPSSLKFFGDHIDRAKVTMFEGTNYTGASCTSYTQDMSDFLLCANKAISMKVEAFTAPTKATNITSTGSWDRPMSAALDTDPTTWSSVPSGTSVGTVFSTNKQIQGIVIHDRPHDPANPAASGVIYLGFGGGASGNLISNNLSVPAAGARCTKYIPPTPIDARWVNIKLIDSSGNTGFSDVEIFSTGGEIRPTINCPELNTSAPRVGESAPPSNWVPPVTPTLKTPGCDSKTFFLYAWNGSTFADKCPTNSIVTGTTSQPCGAFAHFGGSSTISLPDSPLLNSNKLDISMCVNVVYPGHPMTFIRREMQAGGNANQFDLITYDTKLSGGAYCGSGHLVGAVIPSGWHVIGIKFDSPYGTVALSIDGVVIDSVPAAADSGNCPTWNSGYGPLIMGNNRANSDYLVGDVAWVKIGTP